MTEEPKKEEPKPDLFRQEALDAKRKRQIEELMIVVNPKGWLALATFCFIAVVVLIWSWVGRIPAESLGTSIVINHSNNFTIDTLLEGRIAQICVQEGQHVREGELLAVIDNPDVSLELADTALKKILLEQQVENYTAYHKTTTEAEIKAIHETIMTDEWEIFRLRSEIDFFEKDLTWKKELYEQGLVALPQINETIQKINQNENSTDRARISILQNEAKLKKLNEILQFQKYQNEVEQLANKIRSTELKQEQLKIKTPLDGTVISIPITRGTEVQKGQMIAWIEPDGKKDPVIYGYFTSKREQQIKPGMIGHVQLNSVDSTKYGSLVVKVERVWNFPISSDEVYNTIGNHQIVNLLTKNGADAPVQILCTPVRDPNTPSGLKWTSRKGPPQEIRSGSMGNIRVIVEEKRPIEFVFPFFRVLKNSVGCY